MRLRHALLWLVAISVWPIYAAAQVPPFGITLPRSLDFAISPSPVGSGARAQGQAIAFIGVADDATAASHNPGGLVQLEQPEMSIVGSYFVRFERQNVDLPDTVVDDQTLDNFSLNYLSVAFPFRLLQRSVVVSLNYQRLFDLRGATDATVGFTIPGDDGALAGRGRHDVSSRQDGGLFTISPAIAVQLSPTFSLGVAMNIWPDIFGNGWTQKVKVKSSGLVFSGNQLVPFESKGEVKEDFDFEGLNTTAGFLWTISSVISLGGVFRSPFTGKLTRTNRSSIEVTLQDGSPPVSEECTFRETLDLKMPLAYGLGLAARLSTRLRLSLDLSRVHWSDFRLEESDEESEECSLLRVGVPVGKGQAVLNGEGDDTTSVRLGTEYLWVRPTVVIPFRAGFFYDPEPGDGGIDDFFGFSLGTGIAAGPFLFDIAYIFRTGTIKSQATDTSVYQHQVLASIIYHF